MTKRIIFIKINDMKKVFGIVFWVALCMALATMIVPMPYWLYVVLALTSAVLAIIYAVASLRAGVRMIVNALNGCHDHNQEG